MDDITSKLTEILDSPEGMEKIKNMADMLFSGDSGQPAETKPELPMQSLIPDDMAGLMRIMTALNDTSGDDSTVNLLYALKPHLSEAKQRKVDTAVKLIKLYRLLPLFKEVGFF